ncbi:MAG TPA: class I adenylate-forming enzyme family protein [Acidimicrobiales bacterium]|nr:class I adenylate-forming enzyme family protein [Acidimicrobiales bacterium]
MPLPLLVGEIFANAARAAPDRPAAVVDDRVLDFAALEAGANRLARALAADGIATGSRVAGWTGTSLEAVLLFASLAKLGAVFVPLNGLFGVDEVQALLPVACPDLVVADEPRAEGARALDVSVRSLPELVEQSAAYSPERLDAPALLSGEDPHVVFFTSGSTGQAKGVVLSHQTNWLRSHPGALPEPRGAMVCPYPLFHMGAWTIALQQWQARDTVVMVPPDAEAIADAVMRNGASRLNCIPAVWRRLLDGSGRSSSRGAGRLASLRFADTGTSATPPELLDAMAALLPDAHLRVFYGSTEAGTVTCLDQGDMTRKPGSCGVPAPGVAVRLDDAGQIWVRSATVFDGYLDDPEATASVLVDGWFGTGDLADVDGDGFLTIVGRTGEVVRSGGEAVVPAEVEAVVRELASVADVAVVGVPDATWGEVVCAVVVGVPGRAPPTLSEVRAHCQDRLASFKQPRRVEVVDAIPRTPATGQVQRKLLVERLARA